MWLISFPVSTTDLAGAIHSTAAVLKTEFSERFADDKTVSCESDDVFLIDGVLLNKRELYSEYQCGTLNACIKQMHAESELFFSKFRGPFTGFYYDIAKNSFFAYGNQTGDAALYYHYDGKELAVSSDFNALFKFCKVQGYQLTFNPIAANHMLTFGFLTEGNTVAAEIRKLNPGECISVKNGEFDVFEYHHFQFGQYTISKKSEAIKAIDEIFRKAVQRCFDKDLEYGYSHLADISGGLDSRMTNCVAKSLGYHPIFNICYAKKNSRDEEYAKTVAESLRNEFYFEPLDDISFLFDLEKLVRMNYGQAVYSGITGGERMLAKLDFGKYGLEHTGQLGDAIVSYSGTEIDKGVQQYKSICYSTLLEPEISPKKTYTNGEELFFYYRCFHGALVTHYTRRNYTEAVSPFIDVDFLQLCLNISDELRRNHKLYWTWINSCYPKEAKIPSTRNRGNLRMTIYHKLPSSFARKIIKICKAVGLTSLVSDRRGMNPFDYWYASNENLRSFIDRYYETHRKELESMPEVLESVDKLFCGERTGDKLQALTVLASNYIYFCKTDE